MDRVTVTKPGGATLTGPLRVKLTKEQHARRAHLLGPWVDGGLFDIGGEKITFKRGEVFEVDGATERLAREIGDVEAVKKRRASKKTAAAQSEEDNAE